MKRDQDEGSEVAADGPNSHLSHESSGGDGRVSREEHDAACLIYRQKVELVLPEWRPVSGRLPASADEQLMRRGTFSSYSCGAWNENVGAENAISV